MKTKAIDQNKICKAAARGQLLGHYPVMVLIHFYTGAVVTLLSELFRSLINPGRQLSLLLIFAFVQFILLLLSGLLTVGRNVVHMNLTLGKEISFLQVMQGLTVNSEKTLKAELLIAVHILLRALPFLINLIVYILYPNPLLLYPMGFLFLLALLHALILQLNYSQIFYLVFEEPDADLRELLEGSTLLMQGHKMQYFKLLLSFIGLYLLCLLTFGIGYLWAEPYFYSAKANFHLNLLREWKKRRRP